MKTIATGLAAHGFGVVRFEFPYMREKRRGGAKRGPDRQDVLLTAWRNGDRASSAARTARARRQVARRAHGEPDRRRGRREGPRLSRLSVSSAGPAARAAHAPPRATQDPDADRAGHARQHGLARRGRRTTRCRRASSSSGSRTATTRSSRAAARAAIRRSRWPGGGRDRLLRPRAVGRLETEGGHRGASNPARGAVFLSNVKLISR